jgi:hypothetical protein
MLTITDIIAHEPHFFSQISVYLLSNEFNALRSTCTFLRYLPPVFLPPDTTAPSLFLGPGHNEYLHPMIPFDRMLVLVRSVRARITVLTKLGFASEADLTGFVDGLTGRESRDTFFATFSVSEWETGDFVFLDYPPRARKRQGSVATASSLSREEEEEDGGILVRLILKRVPRVGLAMGVELKTTGRRSADFAMPLVRISTADDVILRAGFRSSDVLRETDPNGFWTDLVPVQEATPFRVACRIELNDVWR